MVESRKSGYLTAGLLQLDIAATGWSSHAGAGKAEISWRLDSGM
jgi:hypothetical protein